MKNLIIGGLLLCLFFGIGFGAGFGFERSLSKQPLNQTLIEKHMEFMQAMHSGNFELAKQIAKEYNFGPRWLWDEELYKLHIQLYNAYKENNQEKIQELKNQIFELNKNKMPSQGQKIQKSGFRVKNSKQFNCPCQSTNSTTQTQ